MDIQKVLIKTAYCLVGLSILVIIGLTIYSHHLIKQQSEDSTTEKITNIDSPGESAPGAVEENNWEEGINNTTIQRLDRIYAPLYKMMGLSNEEIDELKELLADRRADFLTVRRLIYEASTPEEKVKLTQHFKELQDKYNNNLKEFLGQKKHETFRSYDRCTYDRSVLLFFNESDSIKNSLSEAKMEPMISQMCEARMNILDEAGLEGDKYILTMKPSDLTMEEKSLIEKLHTSIFEKYGEISNVVLPPDQSDKFKLFLEEMIRIKDYKSMLNWLQQYD